MTRGLPCVLSEAPLGTDVFVRLPKLVSQMPSMFCASAENVQQGKNLEGIEL